jgi:nitrate/nitrite transport system substrate-binding protein
MMGRAMPVFDDPFDCSNRLHPSGCACGQHLAQAEHEHADRRMQCAPVETEEHKYQAVVASAVMRAIFPKDAARRALLKSVGASTALAALSQFFPLKTATELFAQSTPRAIEKKDLKVGFIPITCATPIIMAQPMGFYGKYVLNVDVIKTAGWAVIRDKTLNKEYDAAHMLSPMPLAISLGAGSTPIPYTMPAVENINGQAITLAVKHKDKRDPKSWKGFKFAVPFDYSMHNYLLRYYVAEYGLDPDQDIQIRAVPPPEMMANLRADNIDGFLAPDPVNQRGL